MNTEEIVNAVVAYAKKPYSRREYAIMIDGGWGSGKTYFWKNTIKPALDNGGYKFPTYYVSLYGLENAEQIYDNIIYQHFGEKVGRPLVKAITAVGKNLFQKSVGIDINDILNINSKITLKQIGIGGSIVCIDDLERLSSKIELNEVLGIIMSLVIEYNVGVIMLTNDKEVANQGANNVMELSVYQKAKEKVIGRTFTYDPPINDAIKSKIQDINGKVGDILRDNLEILTHITSAIQLKNIRTIFYVIDLLTDVLTALEDEDENDMKALSLDIVSFTYLMGYSIRLGIKNVTKNLQPGTMFADSKFLYSFNIDENISGSFSLFGNSGDLFRFESIECFVNEGLLDKDKIKEEFRTFARMKNYKPSSEADRVIDQFTKDWLMLDDNEFENVFKNVCQILNTGGFNIVNLLNLNNIFTRLSESNAINLSQIEVDTLFNKSAEMFFHGLKNKIEFLRVFNKIQKSRNNAVALTINRFFSEAEETASEKWILAFENIFSMSPSEIRVQFIEGSLFYSKYKPYLHKFRDLVGFVDSLFCAPNYKIAVFNKEMKNRYVLSDNLEPYCEEKANLKELVLCISERLNNKIAQKENSSKIILIKELLDHLKDVVEKIEIQCLIEEK